MSNDISTIAAGLLRSLYQIPAFDEIKKAIESGALQDHPESTLGTLFPLEQGTVNGEALDRFYQDELNRILAMAKGENVIYRYLGFTADFRLIKTKYLRYRAERIPNYVGALQEEAHELRLLPEYIDLLKNAEGAFHQIDDTFEFVNLIDSLNLQALARVAVESGNEYVQNVVKQKIANYHLMTVLRLTQLGKAREDIERLFISVHELGVSAKSLEALEYRDVVTEIGTMVGMQPSEISVTAIETHLMNREMSTINRATFEGVSGERIIQYFERLRYFIADVKVALAAHAMGLSASEVTQRLVIYDAK